MYAAYCCLGGVVLAFRMAVLDNDGLKKDEGRAVRAQDEQIQGAKDCESMLENELAFATGRDILSMSVCVCRYRRYLTRT